MRGIVRTVAAGLAATTALTMTVGSAMAGGFAIREQSAYGQGSSFAGVTAGGDSIATMFWNPATMTQHSGLVVEGVTTLIAPSAEIDVISASNPAMPPLGNKGSGDIGVSKVVPASYVTYQVSDDLFVGLAITSPFGLVTDADLDWAGRFHARTSDIMTINVNPNVAYRVNDFISIGVGVQGQWIDARLTNAQVVAPLVEGDAELVGDDIAFGFTAGITFTPTEQTTIGLGFRSALDHELEGDAKITGLPGGGKRLLGDISADLTLPEQVTLGVRHQLTDQWTLLGQAEWTNWSRLEELRVEFDSGQADSVLDLQWDDGWFFSVGAEYKMTPELTLRGGIAYELSPIPDETRNARLPDSDRLWLSAGATYNVNNRLSLDIGYSHIFAKGASIELDGSGEGDALRGSLFGEADASVDILSAAVRYKFGGDPAPVPPSEPLIRKP